MKFLYLLIDLGSFLVPFIFSFHPKIRFNRYFRSVLISLFLVAVPFIVWDIFFTSKGVWGFNPKYLTGWYFFNLPIEEVLFFFMIPFSCLFTMYTLKKFWIRELQVEFLRYILWGLVFVLLVVSFLNFNRYYTSWALFFDALTLSFFLLYQPKSVTAFFLSYLVLQIPFFIVNGILTGTGIEGEVVWYNNNENLGIRALTIPIEDFFYGMTFILLNQIIFERLTHHEAATKNEIES